MKIRNLVSARMASELKIFNREGNQIPDTQIKSEYQTLRQYLLDFYSNESDSVAIKQTKDYRYFLTMLACLEIGIPYVPMKYDYPMDRVSQIQEDAKFTLLVDDAKFDEILNYRDHVKSSLPAVDGERAAYTIFTSGTTGRPKGVVIQRKALENFLHFMGEEFRHVSSDERMLQCTEFNFDLSVMDVAFFLNRGVGIYFSNFQNNIFKWAYEIETHKISLINTVPNNMVMFLTDFVAERMDYGCLKYLTIGGARFSYGLYQKCLQYFTPKVEIYNFYGPTEATVYCHFNKISYQENRDCTDNNVCVGKPLPGVEAFIMLDGQIVGPNQRGELYVGGIQVMKGYVNDPEQTRKALVEFNGVTYYRTGDLAFMNERGEYYIVGRADDTIKYRGFRINLLDIDSYITRLPYIQDSITIAIPHEETENQTLGFLILKEEKTVKEIKKDLAALLLDYQIPEKIFFVQTYPTNNSGKVCRKTLKSQYLESINKA